jgi:hypothetical protein
MSEGTDNILCIASFVLLGLFFLGMVAGTRKPSGGGQAPVASLGKFVDEHWTIEVFGDTDKLEREIGRMVRVESWEHVGRNRWIIHLDYRNDKGDARYVVEAINRSTTL